MMVYRLDREGNRLVELEETTFQKEKIIEPIHIEEWVRKNPELLCDKDENIKIISKQQIYETRKRSDLVAKYLRDTKIFQIMEGGTHEACIDVARGYYPVHGPELAMT